MDLATPKRWAPSGLFPTVLSATLATIGWGITPASVSGQDASFSKEVAPILVTHCGNCHVRGRKGGFQMTSHAGLLESGKVTAGRPGDSPLMQLIEAGKMPPRGEVPEKQVETLRRWIASGAGFDGSDPSEGLIALAEAAPPLGSKSEQAGGSGGAAGQDTSYYGDYEDEYADEEMTDEDPYADYYGDDSGGGGGGYGGGRRSDNPLIARLTSRLGGIEPRSLLAIGQTPAPPSGPVLQREAEEVFASGNLAQALNLYFAHMVAEYDQAGEALAAVRYSRPLLRPVWHIRWGVSVMIRGRDDEVDDFEPIRAGQTAPRIAARGGGGGGADPYAGDDFYGDDYGGAMDEEMEDEGDYSDYYGEGMGGAPERPAQPAEEEPAEVEVSMLDESARERLDEIVGLVAERVEAEFGERYREGRFGSALTDVAEPEDGTVAGPNYVSPEYPMWIPGVVYLGEAPSSETLEKAREQGLDLLMHFDVGIRPGPEGSVQNVSRLRIVHVPTGKPLGVSKAFDNTEAARYAQFDRMTEDEYVDQQLQNLLEIVDSKLPLAPMPKLTSEVAKRRVGSLLTGSGLSPLRVLAEVRLYQSQGLLSQDEVEAAFQIVAGDRGLKLLYGPQEQRLEVARAMARGE